MGNPICCLKIIGVDFFSPANRQGELWVKLRKFLGKNWGKQNWLFGGMISRIRY